MKEKLAVDALSNTTPSCIATAVELPEVNVTRCLVFSRLSSVGLLDTRTVVLQSRRFSPGVQIVSLLIGRA